MCMNKIAVVMSSDNNQAFALANVIIGLKRYNERLIGKIYIYHDIDIYVRECINKIWPEVIEFIEYKYENFLQDAGNEVLNIPVGKKYGHFIFSKFHLFEYVDSFLGVLWLDCDVLITGNIASFLDGSNDVFWRYGDRSIAYKYLNKIGLSCSLHEVSKPNGGMIFVKNTITQKIHNTHNITKELFNIFLDLFKQNIITMVAQADEIPFAVVQKKYGLTSKDSKGIANVFPSEDRNNALIIHTPLDIKFWQHPCSFFVYQEWYVNHKIWQNKYFCREQKLSLDLNMYNSYSECYNKLLYSYLFNNIYNDVLLFCESVFNNFYLCQNNNFLDIKFKNSDRILYRILINTWAPIRHCSYEIQLICKNVSKDIEKVFYDVKSKYSLSIKKDKNEESICLYLKYRIKYDRDIFFNEFKLFILLTFSKIEYLLKNKIEYINNKNIISKSNRLLNFHNSVLCLDDKGERLISSNDVKKYVYIECICNSSLLFVILNNKKYYIQSINKYGYITISTNKFYFDIIFDNNKISIKYAGKFLSARKDNTLSLVENKKEWEEFTIISSDS